MLALLTSGYTIVGAATAHTRKTDNNIYSAEKTGSDIIAAVKIENNSFLSYSIKTDGNKFDISG